MDAFCENRVGTVYTKMGGGGNIRRNGALICDPVRLRAALGRRWLSTDFRMGDLLMFSIDTVHDLLDSRSNRVGLSSDSSWLGPNPGAHGAASKRALIC